MKRAVIFSSGGAKGAFQAGAVSHLVEDRGLDFDVIAGVSTGSLNAALLAQGRGLDGLREQVRILGETWLSIEGTQEIYKTRPLSPVLFFFNESSFLTADPLAEKIDRLLDPERIRTAGREFRIGSVVLETGEFRLITQKAERLHDWVLASASIPIAFPPVEVDGVHAVDGGIRQFSPLEYALDALNEIGADDEDREVYCLMADPLQVPDHRPESWNGRTVGERVSTIPPIVGFRGDFARALRHNRAVRAYLAARREIEKLPDHEKALEALDRLPYQPPAFRETTLHVVAPERSLMGSLDFDPAKIRSAFEAGKRAARSPLGEEALDRLIDEES